jgi:hypothetical protein
MIAVILRDVVDARSRTVADYCNDQGERHQLNSRIGAVVADADERDADEW